MKLAMGAGLAISLAFPLVAQGQTTELRLGGIALATRQNVVGPSGLIHNSGTVTGAELLLRGENVGIFGRYLTGSIGANSFRGQDGGLRMAEARLLIGGDVFMVEAGFILRARATSLGKPRDELVRLGARSSVWLGPSGFSLSIGAGALGRGDTANRSRKWGLVGWEATTALLYQAPRKLPLYAMLGYRYERIRSEANITPVRREELSAILFGVGVRHVGFRKPKETQSAQ